MKDISRKISMLAACAALLAAGSCSNGGSDDETDTGTDPTPDVVEDVAEETPADDPVDDPVPDVEDEPECVYPEGPYGFSAVGQTAGPMAWPSSIKGAEELMDLDHADLEVFFCDPEVQSIIVVIATTWCPHCPNRITNLAGIEDHLNTYGAKVVWVLGDGEVPADAVTYFGGYGADFGWFTDDSDNTMGPNTITDSGMLEGVPWVFVMDGESMEILYDNPTSVYSIVRDLYND
jgi:hypothetical protein